MQTPTEDQLPAASSPLPAAAVENPLISFCLFAYNQEAYIREAVEGAFSQTYSPLEIILSDDCSTDRTFEIMQEMAASYKGPHSLTLNRNSSNLGLINHINYVFDISSGKAIVMAAGDDISFSKRTEMLYETWSASKEVSCVFSNAMEIDCNGRVIRDSIFDNKNYHIRGITLNYFGPFYVPGATAMWSREVVDKFKKIRSDGYCEDSILAWRSGLLSGFAFCSEPLCQLRRHDSNISSRLNESDEQIKERAIINGVKYIRTIENMIADLDAAYKNGHINRKDFSKLSLWVRRYCKIAKNKLAYKQNGCNVINYSISFVLGKALQKVKAFHISRLMRDK